MSSAPRRLYRSLLRELPPRRQQHTPLHRHLRAAFEAPSSAVSGTTASSPERDGESDRSRNGEGDGVRISEKHAEQLAHYLRHQRMYVTLLERYNPALARDPMDAAENVRLTARRVGMNMPQEYRKE